MNNIPLEDIKQIIRYMRGPDYKGKDDTALITKKGRRFWFQHQDNLKDKIEIFARKSKQGEGYDFIYDEVLNMRNDLFFSSLKVEDYLSDIILKDATRKFADDVQWLAGTGRYRQ